MSRRPLFLAAWLHGLGARPSPSPARSVASPGPDARRAADLALLALPASATLQEIRGRRRKLAFVHHPDVVGGDGALMARINAAADRLARMLLLLVAIPLLFGMLGAREARADVGRPQGGAWTCGRCGRRASVEVFKFGDRVPWAPTARVAGVVRVYELSREETEAVD